MKKYLLLWLGQTVSSLGSSMVSYALIIWVYQNEGTATSVAMLSFFTFLPSILFSFIAGTFADKWDKKRIMLVCDAVAAMGTVTVFALYAADLLEIWHLYAVNFAISFMNAFQSPASAVAASLLVPKEHYTRAGGLQNFSGAAVNIITPALAAAVLAFAGLQAVFVVDIVTFAFAFATLLFFVKIPRIEISEQGEEAFIKKLTAGFKFLRGHSALLKLILFFSFVNFLAYLTGFGILPAMILARTGGDQVTLGTVMAAEGAASLIGSVLVIVLKPSGNKIRTVFAACAVSFALCNPLLAVGGSLWVWIPAMLGGYIPLPFLNANLRVIMQLHVPIEMQGRVFSTRDTLQFFTIPIGLALGGFLADNIFEPLMKTENFLSGLLSPVFDSGAGAGIAVMFMITGIVGAVSCLFYMRDPAFKELR